MRVVVAVDGSGASYEAAQALRHLTPAQEVTVLYAVDVPRLAYPATTPGLQKEFATKTEQAMRKEGEQILDRVSAILKPGSGSLTRRIETGSPAEVILAEIEKVRADLVVLGSRGLGQVNELLLGSVSHRITTHAPCSTFLVKSAMPQLHHVLVPVESREDATEAIAFLDKKPFRKPVKVTVLHVLPFDQPRWPVGAVIPDSLRSQLIAEAQKVADETASRLVSPTYRASGRVRIGDPAVAIREEAGTAQADLILMKSNVRSGASRFFLGSVSHSVVHHVTCPILLIR